MKCTKMCAKCTLRNIELNDSIAAAAAGSRFAPTTLADTVALQQCVALPHCELESCHYRPLHGGQDLCKNPTVAVCVARTTTCINLHDDSQKYESLVLSIGSSRQVASCKRRFSFKTRSLVR